MHLLHDPTSVVVIEVVEPKHVPMTNQPTDQSTQKGKAAAEPTEVVHAWAYIYRRRTAAVRIPNV
jgi:hypothetical protein